MAGFGLAWTVLAVTVIIPALHPDGIYAYSGMLDATRVLQVARESLLVPGTATAAALIVAAGAGAFCVRSAMIWAVAAPWLVRVVTPNPSYWVVSFHYWLLPAVALSVAAIDAVRRTGWGPRRAHLLVLAVVLSSTWSGLVAANALTQPCRVCEVQAGLDRIPDGARVATDVYLTPQLSGRTRVSQLRTPTFTDDTGRRIDADWLVLRREANWLDDFTRRLGPDWHVVLDVDTVIVWRRT